TLFRSGVLTNNSAEVCDAGPGTPHGVWPLEAADDLEPGGTAARHLYATLSGIAEGSQGKFMPELVLAYHRQLHNIRYCSSSKPDDDKGYCSANKYRAEEIDHETNYLNPSYCATVLCSPRPGNGSHRS